MRAIELNDVWLKYPVTFREKGKSTNEDFWALKGIDLNIDKGEIVGVIGENGSGKTSLLKIIAGMVSPDKGKIKIDGKISTFISISSGFQVDFTGRENIYLVASLYGLSKEKIDAQLNKILEFASLGRFIDAQLKSYSQGMLMRLAFAIGVHVDTDILLVDEVFAVGDDWAQRKCIDKMFELKQSGKTIVFVLHDLMTLRRICTRGIFIREGKIIKDGLIDSTCDYYLETVGEKKGIVIKQKVKLGIVFNNGKLVFRWGDHSLNIPIYGFSTITFAGKKYSASSAHWQITASENDNEIFATGRWNAEALCQQIKIKLINEKEFSWQVFVQVPSGALIQKYETPIIFSNLYSQWFTLDSEESFPKLFSHPEEWDCNIVKGIAGGLLGVVAKDSEKLPTVILDSGYSKSIVHLGNSGSIISGRVVTYENSLPALLPGNSCSTFECFSVTLRMFDKTEELLLQDFLAQRRSIVENSKSINYGHLRIICEDHFVSIYLQDILLTRGLGLNTKFSYKGKVFSATEGRWRIAKANEKEIVITLSWDEDPPFNFFWRLRFENNKIYWIVEMEVKEKLSIRNKEVELILTPEYESWFASETQGNFDNLEICGNVVLSRYTHSQFGTKSLYRNNNFILPAVLFSYEEVVPRAAYISKTKEQVVLRYIEMDLKENQDLNPGRYEYFKGCIQVTDNPTYPKPIQNKLISTIKHKKITFGFEHGKGSIFWGDLELTKKLGFYSSVLHNNLWVDSSHAYWEVEKSTQQYFVATGRWPGLSLMQIWELKIEAEDTIAWKITSDLWERSKVERWQVGCMLTDAYKEWFIPGITKGAFPVKFREHRGLSWERLWYGAASSFGVRTKNLPQVLLSQENEKVEHSYAVENTDILFAARALLCEFISPLNDNPEHSCYLGKIKMIK
jgi:ABC-type polysaccharide/polyol phosphate transport system ATPase subunit